MSDTKLWEEQEKNKMIKMIKKDRKRERKCKRE